MDMYLRIIVIIFVVCVTFRGLILKEHFPVGYLYINNKNPTTPIGEIFNIDTMINEQPDKLGWKSFWRKTQSNSTVPLGTKIYNPYHKASDNKFLFDGVRETKCL